MSYMIKIISMKNLILFFSAFLLLAVSQRSSEYTITGKVIDIDSQKPLIGVNVQIKGTQKGILTNAKGEFSLKTTTKCVKLEFTYTGYLKEQKEACEHLPVLVKMGKDKKLLIPQDQEVTGQVLTSEDIKELPVRNIHALAAKTAGISVGDKKIRIRGSRSNATEYYMDGIRVQGGTIRKDDGYYSEESYDLIQENKFLKVGAEPTSTFSIDVDAASYSNVRRFIMNNQLPPKDAVRIEELVNYFDYDYPQPEGEDPFEVITEVANCPWSPEHQLVHVGLQGKEIATEHLPASNLVFLIDVSGSMKSANKLPLLQSSFKLLTEQLRPQDRVAMVVYAGAAGVVLPSTSGKDKKVIMDALDQLNAGGSTAGGAGIKLAYKIARENFVQGGNNRVILATDGDFNVGASSDDAMVKLIEHERESGIFLTVLGFGMGNYKDSKMQKLADKGNGNHAYIDNMKEAQKVLVNEFGGTMFTIAKDVKIQIEFNPSKVQAYRLIGYENRLLNKEDFDDDKKDAGELGAGHTVTALYEIIPAGVNSEFLAEVDEGKEAETSIQYSVKGDDLFFIKLRYKQPDGAKSKLIEKGAGSKVIKLSASSENFRWSAAVAEFGLLLRDSEYKGTATFAKAAKLAKQAKGKDANGYRKEFIQMIELADKQNNTGIAGKGKK
jgi:Ca-activated chloride channel family protein